MDDISFFDTRPLKQRGGIWSEAAKRSDQPVAASDLDAPSTAREAKKAADGLSKSDNEGQRESTATTSALSRDETLKSRRARKPDADSATTADPAPTTAAASLSHVLTRDAAAISAAQSSDSLAGSSKRKSWFPGGKQEGMSASMPPSRRGTRPGSFASGTASVILPGSAPSAGQEGEGEALRKVPSAPTELMSPPAQPDQPNTLMAVDADGNPVPLSTRRTESPAPAIPIRPSQKPASSSASTLAGDAAGSSAQSIKSSWSSDSGFSNPASPPAFHDEQRALFAKTGPSVILTPAQQARYDAARSASNRLQNLQAASSLSSRNVSGALLSSWNKARSTLADKDSRQAAAQDAKEAVKRGWANWQSRRNVEQRGATGGASDWTANPAQTNDRHEELHTSSGSAASVSSREEGWLASSPPDPTSMAIGIRAHSPARPTLDTALSDPVSEDHGEVREGRSRTTSAATSRSSSASRQSYRDHRAGKAAARISDELARLPSPLKPPTHSRSPSATSADGTSASSAFLPSAPVATTSVATNGLELSQELKVAAQNSPRATTVSSTSPQSSPAKAAAEPTPTKDRGIRVQPQRAAMMAIPGIPAASRVQVPASLSSDVEAQHPSQTATSAGEPKSAATRDETTPMSDELESPPMTAVPKLGREPPEAGQEGSPGVFSPHAATAVTAAPEVESDKPALSLDQEPAGAIPSAHPPPTRAVAINYDDLDEATREVEDPWQLEDSSVDKRQTQSEADNSRPLIEL